jgi:hypothetical protein
MVKDHNNEESNGDQIIEAFITEGDIGVMIPIMATQLYMVDRNGGISQVKELRIRNLKEEKENG